MKRILITGKGSYVGSSFIEYCSKNNYNFKIDELSLYGDKWKETNFSKYDTVFHVAGIAHTNPSKDEAPLYYAINRDLAIEVAQHAKNSGVKQFVFMSSAIVYTSSIIKNGKITYETIPRSSDFYGDSKLQAERGLNHLQDNNFKIAILRPPVIYGKGSKGNYPKLAKLARRTPIFPNFNNKRSMLHVDNLCELIRLIIINEDEGVYFPQNSDYVTTTDLVKIIADYYNNRIMFTKVANPIIKVFKNITIVNKIFGDFYYEKRMSKYKNGDYQVRDLRNSIKVTERSD